MTPRHSTATEMPPQTNSKIPVSIQHQNTTSIKKKIASTKQDSPSHNNVPWHENIFHKLQKRLISRSTANITTNAVKSGCNAVGISVSTLDWCETQ